MTFTLKRQGDVLLVAIDEVPPRARPLPREQERLVLAHGEATGHHHAIADRRAELFTTDDELVTVDEASELYLLVHGGDPVELVHEEHAPIPVEPGAYRVRRQREYRPPEPRRAPRSFRRVID
jgi:hypothetical protein